MENKTEEKIKKKQISMGPKMFILFVMGLNLLALAILFTISGAMHMLLGKIKCDQLSNNPHFIDNMSVILYLFAYPLILFLGSKCSKIKFKDLPLKNNNSNLGRETMKFSVIMLGYFLLQFLFMALLEAGLNVMGLKMVEEPNPFTNTIIGNTYYFILLCICAPIVEEIFYRGFLLQNLLKNTESPKLSIVVTGLCFGLMHMNGFPSLIIAVMGMYLAYVAYKTNSLWPSIFLHFLNNFICFIETLFPQLTAASIAIPIDIVLFIISLLAIKKNHCNQLHLQPIPKGTAKLYMKSIWTYIVIVFVVYGFVNSICLA